MTVVDIRNIFSKRNIELFDVNASFIYYAEEKNEDGHDNLFILEYNRANRRERLITNYTLEDPTFVEHLFAFDNSIILVLENGSNSMWLIEIDKTTGFETNRRKVVCTGTFRSCMALDESHLLIYMGPDEANAAMFSRYRQVTGCECLCYLYDMKSNTKQFVKNPLIAKLGIENIKMMKIHGESYVILLDPFGDESIKKSYYEEQRWINADIRDNIWLCSLSTLEKELEAGVENITKKCIASADIKALARYMGTDGDKVYFRAKEFRSGIEKLCSYDIAADAIAAEAELQPQDDGTMYMVEEKPFTLFAVKNEDGMMSVKGIINSKADFSFAPEGNFMTCTDDRYAVTQKLETDPEGRVTGSSYTIYDSRLEKSQSYEGSCYFSGNTLVLY